MHVVLLRGVNVGGRNLLPMKAFADALRGLGATRVRTYLQSGNAVFAAPPHGTSGLAEALADKVATDHGFRPAVALLAAEELHRLAKTNPFPEAEAEPRTLHAFFPAFVPQAPNLAALEKACSNGESYALRGSVLYVHAPNGLGRSKLPPRVPGALGVEVTARNWCTVRGLLALADELQG